MIPMRSVAAATAMSIVASATSAAVLEPGKTYTATFDFSAEADLAYTRLSLMPRFGLDGFAAVESFTLEVTDLGGTLYDGSTNPRTRDGPGPVGINYFSPGSAGTFDRQGIIELTLDATTSFDLTSFNVRLSTDAVGDPPYPIYTASQNLADSFIEAPVGAVPLPGALGFLLGGAAILRLAGRTRRET